MKIKTTYPCEGCGDEIRERRYCRECRDEMEAETSALADLYL